MGKHEDAQTFSFWTLSFVVISHLFLIPFWSVFLNKFVSTWMNMHLDCKKKKKEYCVIII